MSRVPGLGGRVQRDNGWNSTLNIRVATDLRGQDFVLYLGLYLPPDKILDLISWK